MVGGDAVDDEVEGAGVLLHGIGIFGDDDLIGAEPFANGDLAFRGGEEGDLRAE